MQEERHKRKGVGTGQQARQLEHRAWGSLRERQGAVNIRGVSGPSKVC